MRYVWVWVCERERERERARERGGRGGGGTNKTHGTYKRCVTPQPSKYVGQQMCNNHITQGQSTASVATQRAIRHDTVLSYLSEGVLAGYTYDPGHLGITRATAARVIQVLRVRAPEAVGVCEAGGEHDVLRMLQETVGAGLRDVYGWVEGMGSEGGMGLGALRLVVAHVGRVLRAGVKYV